MHPVYRFVKAIKTKQAVKNVCDKYMTNTHHKHPTILRPGLGILFRWSDLSYDVPFLLLKENFRTLFVWCWNSTNIFGQSFTKLLCPLCTVNELHQKLNSDDILSFKLHKFCHCDFFNRKMKKKFERIWNSNKLKKLSHSSLCLISKIVHCKNAKCTSKINTETSHWRMFVLAKSNVVCCNGWMSSNKWIETTVWEMSIFHCRDDGIVVGRRFIHLTLGNRWTAVEFPTQKVRK